MRHWEGYNTTSECSCKKTAHPEPKREETSDKAGMRGYSAEGWPVLFNNDNVVRDKNGWGAVPGFKEAWQLNAMHNFNWDPGPGGKTPSKCMTATTGKSELDNNIVKMLKFFIWLIVQWLCKKIFFFFFLGNRHKYLEIKKYKVSNFLWNDSEKYYTYMYRDNVKANESKY